MKKILVTATFACIALSGCATSYQEKLQAQQEEQRKQWDAEAAIARKAADEREKVRIAALEDYFAQNPRLSNEEKKALTEKRPIIGLTVNESYLFVGSMVKMSESGGVGGTWEIWESKQGGGRWEMFFHEGKLVRWYDL